MPIVADVFREGSSTRWNTFAFEVAPQSGDEIRIDAHSYRVVRGRHVRINAPSGEANMQYQILITDA